MGILFESREASLRRKHRVTSRPQIFGSDAVAVIKMMMQPNSNVNGIDVFPVDP
jgi:hypothetical protein